MKQKVKTIGLVSALCMAMMALLLVTSFANAEPATPATHVADAIWAHGELYGTVITPTTFMMPPEQSTDTIYNFSMSGLMGQHSIADSAPGDRDFNGGRWNVMMVLFTEEGKAIHDPDGDGMVNFELKSAEDVLVHESLGHLIITPADFYFECPMLPQKGHN